MKAWWIQNGGTLIVGLVLAIFLGFLLYRRLTAKRRGQGGCGCGCHGCALQEQCHSKPEKTKDKKV